MKTLENLIATPKKRFTVTPNTTNNNNALLSNILYSEMEHFSKEVILKKTVLAHPTPRLYKLQILKNAYLNDNLSLTSQIKKLNQSELQLLIVVEIENNDEDAIICKAIFKFPLKNQVSEAC
ncbi:hypothetical protein BX611_1633 [Lutibacter oceani]|uniref:Uncharacterized protein n=1 Tax=Lutibacter oceani TaxID=1853311 RepID=A0A3D9RQA1_9FLAO|nr:hypothetical protein [Lutibacter oceani]REE82090.1 hypothetical protein BX611_1633 [Lutibacter oceani]